MTDRAVPGSRSLKLGHMNGHGRLPARSQDCAGDFQKLHFILILQTVKPGRHSCPERGGGNLRPDPPFSLHYARIQNGWVCAFSALKIMCVCFFFKARQNKKAKNTVLSLVTLAARKHRNFPCDLPPKYKLSGEKEEGEKINLRRNKIVFLKDVIKGQGMAFKNIFGRGCFCHRSFPF